MWELRYSQSVYNYMIDNAGYVNPLRDSLRLLATTKDGLPPWGSHQNVSGYLLTDIADHRIEYELRHEEHLLIVWAIQPIDTG